MNTHLDTWWRALGSAALVGTARRPVPDLPELGIVARQGARPEELALDAAALGGTLRRAGTLPQHRTEVPDPAPDDRREAAPRRAVQLLELVLHQPPAGADHRTALAAHWMRCCDRAGLRAPHRLLPALLDVAANDPVLRAVVPPVVDERGRWLARQHPAWTWATTVVPDDLTRGSSDDWARRGSADRVEALEGLRHTDPAGARSLLLTTWSTDAAKDRRAHLETLRIGLGPDDEDVLESALDDRASTVREIAVELLDGLPHSDRARRMAERLRPLVSQTGRLRRTLEVSLPDDPDPSGVRDGLGRPPAGRSKRGWWLERIVAGSPLEVLTDATGAGPEATVSRLHDEDALAGLRQAVRIRHAVDWARALLVRDLDPDLVALLPAVERERLVLDRLPTLDPPALGGLLPALDTPWSPQLSSAAVARVTREKQVAPLLVDVLPHLAAGLHPDALGALQAWRERTALPLQVDRQLGDLVQFHSVQRSITEAFT